MSDRDHDVVRIFFQLIEILHLYEVFINVNLFMQLLFFCSCTERDELSSTSDLEVYLSALSNLENRCVFRVLRRREIQKLSEHV